MPTPVRRVVIAALLTALSFPLSADNIVRGMVIDGKTNEPLPFATVYIDGTSKGTTTDRDGRFELRDPIYPSTLIASYIGYRPVTIALADNQDELTFKLDANDRLPEVTVDNSNEREKNLKIFRKLFLGDDRWGRHATIRNEDALLFMKTTAQRTQIQNGVEVSGMATIFTVWANEPLIVDLPLLGYELQVSLVYFNVDSFNGHSEIGTMGYFYYKPYETTERSKIKKYAKNRRKVYYNSRQHFLRSLYEGCLAENGYRIIPISAPDSILSKREPIDLTQYTDRIADIAMSVRGLKGQQLRIHYYYNIDGTPKPLDQVNLNSTSFSESGISFTNDICIFSKQGNVIQQGILFLGDMGRKSIASHLPNDIDESDFTAP